MGQCTAKSKRSGVRCKKDAMKGMTVCHIHGGKSLVGTNNPAFKHGRYSRYLPDALTDRYHAALDDQDLNSLSDEIALTDSRLTGELIEMRTAGPQAQWSEARNIFAAFTRYTNADNREAAVREFNRLRAVFEASGDPDKAWAKVDALIEQRRKLVETQRRVLLDSEKSIAIDQLMSLIAAVSDIIRRHVASKEARRVISNEIRGLVERTTPTG